MTLKVQMPCWNDFMRDIELETANFPAIKVPLPDPSLMEAQETLKKEEDIEEIM
jgi:hypothetical protein